MTQVIAQPKFVLKSMSIWGALISVLSTAYVVVGPILEATGVSVPVTPTDVNDIGQAGGNAIAAIGALVGSVLTIWGRFRAGRIAQPISIVPNAPIATMTVVKPPAVGKASG